MTKPDPEDDFGPSLLIYGAINSISDDREDDAPVLWIPDPDRPSQYVPYRPQRKRHPIGFTGRYTGA